jgi:glycine cleavage system H protein
MSHIPDHLFYTKDHEWLSGKEGTVSLGVTAYAVEQLGDIVHTDLPKVSDTLKGGGSFGTIESTKTVSDLYIPMGGKVVAINDAIQKDPSLLGKDPYGEGWLIKVALDGGPMVDPLLDSKAYREYIGE